MPIDALYNAIRNAPKQQGWQAAQQNEAASYQAAIDEAVRREAEAQQAAQAQQLWNGYDYNAEAERRAQVGGYTPAPEAFRAPVPTDEYDPRRQAEKVSQAWRPQTSLDTSYNNSAANIPGTEIPYDTERGRQYLALEAQRDAARKAFEPFRTIPGANDAAANVVRDIDARESTLKEYLSDDEYRADVAAQKRAAETYQRQQTMSETEAGNQLAELYRQRDELQKLIGTTSSAFRDSQGQALNSARQEQLARINAQIRQYETDINAVGRERQNDSVYRALQNNPDFAANSGYAPREDGTWGEIDLVNNNRDAWLKYIAQTGGTPAGGTVDPIRTWEYLTDEERGIYNYLYNTRGYDAAKEYVNFLQPDLNARDANARAVWAKDIAKENPVAASLFSVIVSPLKGASAVAAAGDTLSSALGGKGIDPNDPMYSFARLPSDIRTQVSRDIERNYGKPGTFAYNTGMSVLENVWDMALTGGAAGESFMLGIMGSGAMADSVLSAKQRGLSDGQAFALGLMNGAIEAITEKIGLDALYEGIRGGKPALRAILNSTLAEGSEEVLGTFLDDIADMIVAGTDSERMRRIAELKAQGMSDSEAARTAYTELLKEAGVAGLSGALSGLLMSGGAQAIINGYKSAEQGVQNIKDTREQNRVDEMVRMANEEAAARYGSRTAPQTAPAAQETATNPAVSPQNAPQTTNDTAEPTRTEAPIQNAENAVTPQTDEQIAETLDPEAGEVGGVNYSVTDNANGTWNAVVENTDTGETTELRGSYESADPLVKVVQTAREMGAVLPADALASAVTGTSGINSVGAAQAGYNYADMPHEQKVSRQYYTTDRYADEKGAARLGGRDRYSYRKAFTYETRSRAESMARARDELFVTQDGKEVFLGDIDPQYTQDVMNDLREYPAWNDVMTDMAKIVEDHLLAKSLEARISGTPEQAAAARKAYTDWQKTVQERVRAGARGLNVLNDWSGEGNENGDKTEAAAIDAVNNNGKLTGEQKSDLESEIRDTFARVREAGEDAAALKDIIVECGLKRQTLSERENNVMRQILIKNLDLLDVNELRQLAFGSAAALGLDYQPTSIMQKVKTVQVLNMLSNPKTPVTNTTSNLAFNGIDTLAMRLGTLLDMGLSKLTGTRSIASARSVFTREARQQIRKAAARSIAEVVLDVNMGGEGKYSQTGTRSFKMKDSFADKVMSIWERNSNLLLQSTDEFAKGLTRAAVQDPMQRLVDEGRVNSEDENYAQTYADNLARYRTFQNDRMLSQMTRGLHDALNIITPTNIKLLAEGRKAEVKPGKFGLGDIVAPFSKIGGNLVGVALDYSPIKAITGIYQTAQILYKAARATATGNTVTAEEQAKALSNTARGLTGTAIILGFMALVRAGLVRRADDDNVNASQLNQAQNRYGTQLNLTALGRALSGGSREWQDGDTLIDISRFEPFNFMLDLALTIEDNVDETDGMLSKVSGLSQAMLESFGNNVSDMPVFQTVGSFAEDVTKYQNKWWSAAANAGMRTLVSSATPNIVASFAKGIDDKLRDTRTRDVGDDTLLNAMQSTLGMGLDTLISRVPFLRETLPSKRNVMGEEKPNPGSLATRLTNAMLNPMGVNEYDATEATDTLNDIYAATGDASFFPRTRSSTKAIEYTEKGEKHTIPLDYEQRQAFQEAYSTAYWDVANAMVKLPEFKRLAPEEQAKALGKLEKYAYQTAKRPYVGDKHIDAWVRNASKNTTSLARWLVANR